MESQCVYFLVELTVREGQFEEFEQIVRQMTDGTAQEKGALGYEWFVSGDRRKCRLLETYGNQAAVNAHIAGPVVQQLVPKLLGVANLDRFEVYGSPDEQASAALRAFGAEIYPAFAGMRGTANAAGK